MEMTNFESKGSALTRVEFLLMNREFAILLYIDIPYFLE